jgi:hypothetical protein
MIFKIFLLQLDWSRFFEGNDEDREGFLGGDWEIVFWLFS